VSKQFGAGANRRLEFQERSQLFIGARNEMLSGATMRVSHPDFWRKDLHRISIIAEIASFL
jgi:hypothetical protein